MRITSTTAVLALGAFAWIGMPGQAQAQEPEKLDFFGDFRLRAESNHKLLNNAQHDRYRGRLRLRFGANYQATDSLKVGFRARTGNPDDPNSPHQDLGGTGGSNFDSFAFNLDRAFLKYKPEWADGWWMVGGKFGRPGYWNPVYSELVWDMDVQPEGVAFGTGGSGDGAIQSWDFYIGDYILTEMGGGEEATMLNMGAHAKFDGNVDAALNYYFYGDVTPDGNGGIFGDNAGNATNGAGNQFSSEFGIVNPIVAWNNGDAEAPITVSGEFVLNTRAAAGVGDQGWALGAAYGKESKFYYQYQTIEQDAVFSAFAQDDLLMATNHDSHVLGWKYKLADNVGLHIWGLISAPNEVAAGANDDNRYRFRIDFNIKF